ncbi:MAG: 4Fe-4S dicluster domain-containing protein [Desulfitobacterium hafniense]|nr:4Fe-4S dicluster domain-containing protein [Desulfitobacterium hafniense]
MSKLKLSRRNVLKLGALTTASLAIGLPPGKILKAGTGAEKKQIGFMYDQTVCIGCRACEYSCKAANNWEEGAQWRKVLSKDVDNSKVFLSISCNHCGDCACIKVCPVGAYSKRDKDGIVVHDPKKCVGCKYCLYACPYHAPQYSEHTGRITKCHFCYEKQDNGQSPACVAACPTKALKYGDMSDLSKTSGAVAQVKGLPSPSITNPSWVIIPKA